MTYEINLDLNNIRLVTMTTGLTLDDIEINQLYRVVSDPNVIDETGKEKINRFIGSTNLRDPKWENMLPDGYDPYDYNGGRRNRLPSLPSDWSWLNTVTDKKQAGQYGTGKFAKRYRSYVQKIANFALPDQFIQDLGQIAGRYSDQSTGATFRFVEKFDWDAGDFGDRGSCFWGGREHARVMLSDHGAWAVQIFDPDTLDGKAKPKGYGRAWVLPNYPEDNVMTIFNGYGDKLGDPSRAIARILSNFFGMASYQEIELRNAGDTDGTLYINSGRGFVIGRMEGRVKDEYELKWSEKILGTCRHCDESIRDTDSYERYEDYLYCIDCYNQYIYEDELTGYSYDSEYDGQVVIERWVRGEWEHFTVSQDTAENRSCSCDSCSRQTHMDSVRYIATSSTTLCYECANDEVSICVGCDTEFLDADLESRQENDDDDELMLCSVCAHDWDEEHTEPDENVDEVTEIPF